MYPLAFNPKHTLSFNRKLFVSLQKFDLTTYNLHNNKYKKVKKFWLIICLDECNRNGVQQRRNSYQDGVYGTTCPIPPGQNFTYTLQVKDQIGSFFYFPSLAFHKAAGGFGAIKILSRPRIPVPFPDPAGDFSLLIGDWYQINHKVINTIQTLVSKFVSYMFVLCFFFFHWHVIFVISDASNCSRFGT